MRLYTFPVAVFAACRWEKTFTIDRYGLECSDKEESFACTEQCTDYYNTCVNRCDEIDCQFDCGQSLQSCLDACPCFANCPDGCKGCPNSVCQCADLENNLDYVECESQVDQRYAECIVECDKTDSTCLTDCSREYADQIERCPCKSTCPDGCPCPEFECATTTVPVVTTTPSTEAKSAVLILNSSLRVIFCLTRKIT